MTDAVAAIATQAPHEQHSIEMPNGVVMSGAGGDPELIREQLEDRHEARTGQPVPESKDTPAGQPDAQKSRRRLAQERIDQAIAKEKDAARRADAAEARLRELESRASQPASPVKSDEAPKTPEFTRPEPSEDEVGTKYASYKDFVADTVKWHLEQRDAQQNLTSTIDARVSERIEAERASRSFQDTVSAMTERARKTFPDFDELAKNPDGGQPVFLGPPEIHAAKYRQILSLPNAEHIIHAVLKSNALQKELAAIANPFEFGLKLATIVNAPEPAAQQAAPATPRVPMTNAVPPMQPVGSSSRTSQPALSELASKGNDFDASGYRERRAAERKANSR